MQGRIDRVEIGFGMRIGFDVGMWENGRDGRRGIEQNLREDETDHRAHAHVEGRRREALPG
jgi:hypothetical protein